MESLGFGLRMFKEWLKHQSYKAIFFICNCEYIFLGDQYFYWITGPVYFTTAGIIYISYW